MDDLVQDSSKCKMLIQLSCELHMVVNLVCQEEVVEEQAKTFLNSNMLRHRQSSNRLPKCILCDDGRLLVTLPPISVKN